MSRVMMSDRKTGREEERMATIHPLQLVNQQKRKPTTVVCTCALSCTLCTMCNDRRKEDSATDAAGCPLSHEQYCSMTPAKGC